MMFFWFIAIGVIIWYFATRGVPFDPNKKKSSSNARDLLDQRFAKGEIDESTYQRIKHRIEEDET